MCTLTVSLMHDRARRCKPKRSQLVKKKRKTAIYSEKPRVNLDCDPRDAAVVLACIGSSLQPNTKR